ncbi:hypothetical protein HDU87_005811 [Geranomyces variabilis]|uniref:RNA polymerase II subunit B1 CTD phosphatase RPAP2 homolog n=1 Tax=Geranomyces variabilis TaxID=109894 RepID=A0AAD5TG71_9FUNG|nr:hypothetical protein HDU87_005811 [Geranomyces variabilis]
MSQIQQSQQQHPQKPQQQRRRRDIPPPSAAAASKKRPPQLTARQRAYAASAAQKAHWDKLTFQWQTELFEGAVPTETLKAAASFLTSADYADVVIERVADRTCGYPLCANAITPQKGRYRISRAERKVYDTTLLKNFCSAVCLAASDYYARQLSAEPPYMRNASAATTAMPGAAGTAPAGVHVIPVEFATATAAHQEGGVAALKLTRQELVALHVQALLATLPAPIPQPSGGPATAVAAARRPVTQQQPLPIPALLVRENTILEPPRPPELGEDDDRDRAARNLEGFVVVARDPRVKRNKGVRFADEDMVDAMDALAVKDEGELADASSMSQLAKAVDAMDIDAAPPSAGTAVAAQAPTLRVNGAKPSPGPAPRSNIKPRKSNLMVQDTVRERPLTKAEQAIPASQESNTNTDARKHARSSTPDNHPPKRQLKKQQLSLSLFGRTFTTLGRIVTQRTRAAIARQPLPPPTNHSHSLGGGGGGGGLSFEADDDDAEELADAAARAAAAAATRREIFTSQCLATCARIRKRGATTAAPGLGFPVREAVDADLVAVCATLALTERTARLPREEELVLCVLLVRAVEVGGGRGEEGTGRWVGDVLSGTGIGVVEFESLLKLLI